MAFLTAKQEKHKIRGYPQLAQAQRYQIHTLIKAEQIQTDIVQILSVHKFAISRKVRRKIVNNVLKAIIGLLKPISHRPHTLTSDNGTEFAGHEIIARKLKAQIYFAHAYASWERELSKNTNGFIPQYIPKSRGFATITQREIDRVMARLNNRPRQYLGITIPNQVFFGINPPVALAS